MRTSSRAVAVAGIAERPGMLSPPPDSITRMLSVGSLSFTSSRVSGRSGRPTAKSRASTASTSGASSRARRSAAVSGRTSR